MVDIESLLILSFRISLGRVIEADIAAAVVLISMGALLGRTTPIQLVLMALIEIVVYAANEYFQLELLKVFNRHWELLFATHNVARFGFHSLIKLFNTKCLFKIVCAAMWCALTHAIDANRLVLIYCAFFLPLFLSLSRHF